MDLTYLSQYTRIWLIKSIRFLSIFVPAHYDVFNSLHCQLILKCIINAFLFIFISITLFSYNKRPY